MLAQQAIINGKQYALIEVLKQVGAESEIVTCIDPLGRRWFVPKDAWPTAPSASVSDPGVKKPAPTPIDPQQAAAPSVKAHPAAPAAAPPAAAASTTPQPTATYTKVVTSSSDPSEKVALFRSLFRGREDVYAQGFVGARTKPGKINYAPKCNKRFARGECPQTQGKKVRCASCDQAAFEPFGDRAIERHFTSRDPRGRDVIGLYVVDGTFAYLLCVDFDGTDWQREAAAFKSVCQDNGLHPAVERSRSGNGGHVWIFFSDAVEAKVARQAGDVLLTETMRRLGTMRLTAYDRLYPLQDKTGADELGNLIALPLQGVAVRNGNSVFVDDEFNQYPDQCLFLSTIPHANPAHIEAISKKYGNNPVGIAPANSLPSTNSKAAQTAPIPLIDAPSVSVPSAAGGSPCVITCDSAINIPKHGLPPATADALRRLAAFKNPEFSRRLGLHLSLRDVPRYLDLGVESTDSIRLPRGCLDEVIQTLEDQGVAFELADKRTTGKRIHASFTGTLRPLQEPCVQALTGSDAGILVAPTGFGKSVIAAACIAERQVNTLIIVPTTALLRQWRESLRRFLRIDDEPEVQFTPTGRKRRRQPEVIGQIGDGAQLPGGVVDVALAGSLFEKGEVAGERVVSGRVKQYGMVIVDEAQRIPTGQVRAVLETAQARYVYGVTATPRRDDKLDRIMYLLCGPILHEVSVSEQIEEQGMSRILVARFTRAMPSPETGASWHSLMDYIAANDERNAMIVEDAARALNCGRTPIVLTRRVDHAVTLAERLKASPLMKSAHVSLLVGRDSEQVRREKLQALYAVAADTPICVVATGSYVGVGFDYDRLDTLLLAGPVAFGGALAQWVGRLHRIREDKHDVAVIDYVDPAIPMFDREWRRRLREYRRLGYVPASSDELGAIGIDARSRWEAFLYDRATFADAFTRDLDGCKARVLISTSWVHHKRVAALLPTLESACAREVQIRLMLPAKDAAADARAELEGRLCELGVEVVCTDEVRLDAAVFDDALVWYGSIAPFGFAKRDDCSLRITNPLFARELAEWLDACFADAR